jgi:hypothetical protein
MDPDFCNQQAKLVRSLAEKADPFIKRRLLQLAEHYERRLAILKNAREPDDGAVDQPPPEAE